MSWLRNVRAAGLACLLVVLTATQAQAAITLVGTNKVGVTGDDSTTSGNLALPSNVTAGNTVLLIAQAYNPSDAPFVSADCTKSAGTATVGPITLRKTQQYNWTGSNYWNSGIWEIPITGSGSLTLLVSNAPAGSYWVSGAGEFTSSRGFGAIRFDTGISSGGTGTSTAPDSGNVTSTTTGILFGGFSTTSAGVITITPDGAFTQLYEEEDGSAHDTGSVIYRLTAGSVTDSASWTISASGSWLAIVASFVDAATAFLEPGTDATQDLTFYPNNFVGASGAATSATDRPHIGPRALKIAVTGGAGSSAFIASADGACADTGTRASAWFQFDTLPGVDSGIFASYEAGFGDVPIHLVLTTAGKLRLYSQTTAMGAAGATVIAADTWTRISWAWVITSTTNWTVKIWINGVLELTRTNADGTLGITGTSEIAMEVDHMGGSADTFTFWADDVYVDNSSALTDPGDVRVTSKRPIANGTTNGFTTQIGAGGSGTGSGHSPQVNEQPLSQTNGWSMVGAGAAITEEYNVESVSAGDVNLTGQTIVDVGGWAFAKSLVSETASLILKNNTTSMALTSTPTLFTAFAASSVYPAGSGTDIGMITATDLTTVSLYEAGVLVAYNVVVASTLHNLMLLGVGP